MDRSCCRGVAADGAEVVFRGHAFTQVRKLGYDLAFCWTIMTAQMLGLRCAVHSLSISPEAVSHVRKCQSEGGWGAKSAMQGGLAKGEA